MDILGTILGGPTQNQSTNQNSNSTTKGTSKTTQSQSQSQATQQNAQQQGQVAQSSLDQDTIDLIKGMVGTGGLSGGASSSANQQIAGLSDLISRLDTRAQGGMDNLQNTIAAQQAEAQRQFGLTTGSQIAQAQQATGSRFGNSFSQLLQNQGSAELQTALAKVASDAALQAQAQQSQDFATVGQLAQNLPQIQAQAEQSGSEQLVGLLNILKGAQTTGTTSQTSASTLVDQLTALLNSQTDTDQTTKTTAQGSSKSGSGLLSKIF